jgi:hypothetical protein
MVDAATMVSLYPGWQRGCKPASDERSSEASRASSPGSRPGLVLSLPGRTINLEDRAVLQAHGSQVTAPETTRIECQQSGLDPQSEC